MDSGGTEERRRSTTVQEDEIEASETTDAPLGVKFLICFLLADATRRGVELGQATAEANGGPNTMIFILWIAINLLLALLLGLRTRAGRLWTQAILVIHVFYLGHELVVRAPYLWVAMGLVPRARIVATIFMDGLFVAYLNGERAKAYLQDGP
jgi:hypothetical protein